MEAKLIHSLTDDNPDLQRQIGCKTGIFQIFDPQHILTGRRIVATAPSRFLRVPTSTVTPLGQRLITCTIDQQQRTAQHRPFSFDQATYPETPSKDPAMSQSGASPQFRRQSLDLGDGDKASAYREAQRLSVKTTFKEELEDCEVKHKKSPRPMQLSDGSSIVGIKGKQTLRADVKQPLRVLAKLRETTRRIDEDSRLSCEMKDRPLFSFQKDAPRYSYDGSDLSRLSFESWDAFKSTSKLNELPRLSLDSRVGSMQRLNSDSKSISGAQTRSPSVVAKLMGLETLPDADLASDNQLRFIKTCPVEDFDPFSRSLKSTDPRQSIQTSNSLGNSWQEPALPCWRKPESVMKPSSRVPIEPAAWKQLYRNRGSHKSPLKHLETPGRETNTSPSIYSEIEKRFKNLEFTKSGKDLRALKQIMEAMQANGLLETRKDEQDSNSADRKDHGPRYKSPHLSARLVNHQKLHSDHVNHSTNKGGNFLTTSESAIAIMKPEKLVEKSGILVSSVILVDRLSGLPKLRCEYAYSRKSSVNSRTSKEQIPKTGYRENAATSNDNRKTINRTLKSTESSPRALPLPKENTISSVKSSGTVSPRLQQKKFELEKRSRPPIPSDSSKSRRQANKQQQESDSPGGRRRPKSAKSQQSNGYFMDLRIDTEVTSAECCAEANGCWSPSMKAAKYSVSGLVKKKLAPSLSEVGAAEFASVASEHPSPVSVLDDTMYKDDAMSPAKQMPDDLKDEGTVNSKDNSSKEQWGSAKNPMPKSEINRKKLENIEQLVQKLRRLNSSHDEAQTDYIASLCENTNPDHRYISEILLASGFLLRDLNSILTTFQLHPSGRLINPELFLVLEQTKTSTSQKEETSIQKVVHMKPNKEKLHRKLMFDAVNEILVGKLTLVGASPKPWLKMRKSLNAQKLLREMCSEIDQLQAIKSDFGLLEDEDDWLKRILWEHVTHWSENWTDFHGEISGMSLDVERLIFKDLVDEIVHGEATSLRTKPGRHCRRIFA
ncbi:protein LONGIFOLIA 1-like isoform X1 [Actinidia eriantha]|uniref:protein LONGIFOLIA 1-like isoform X1 n=2 Tax=Actinidia eriantha TaxID=165200 RepID=UPI002590CD40|nr:protein LONGIFOLIA 1-like isoform X1 [Actinidia eriantha]